MHVQWHAIDDSDSDSSCDYSVAPYPPASPSISSSSGNSDWDRSMSPVPSIMSMTSSFREDAFIKEYGRLFNSHSEVYRLPADEEEFKRLGMFLRQPLLFL
jgi:hypothetical protein